MTASDITHAERNNSGGTDLGAQFILEVIQERNCVSLRRLVRLTNGTKQDLREVLEHLQERDLIDVTPGIRDVWVTAKSRAHDVLAPDRGPIRRIVDALTSSPTTLDISEEEFYKCLESNRRRRTIRIAAAFYDEQARTFIDVAVLANLLADVELDGSAGDSQRQYISLIQVHLPQLDELGFINYFERVKKFQSTEQAVLAASLMTEVDQRLDTGVNADG